jgi:ABC-2 type transport system ATP-binding protein
MTGLLGPNGAGKTTTVSMICGLVRPDEGQVLVNGSPLGQDDDPAKRRIGLVPQDPALFDELTAQQNLELFGALYDLGGARLAESIERALKLVGLSDRRNDAVAVFSGGMKRRLNLAAALLHDPEVILLDEPTVGVDPQSRNAIFENLEGLKRSGKALLYTTHYMEEAERLCDRIIIIDHGRMIADDTQQGIYRLLPAPNVLHIHLTPSAEPVNWLVDVRSLDGIRAVDLDRSLLRIGVVSITQAAPRILDWLNARGVAYDHVSSERANLETVFLTLTGRSLRDS